MEEKEIVLSPSRIGTYKKCPRSYYYNYVAKLPRKEWDHFALGTFVHGVLEIFHMNFRQDTKEINLKKLMKDAFKQQKEASVKENIVLTEEVLLQARDILMAYLKRTEDNGLGAEILSLEEEFELDISEKYGVRGIVDRIDRDPDGVLHIKDYKTSKNMKYMEPFQLQVYGIFLLNKYPETDFFRGSYIMLRHDSMLISYDLNIEDVIKNKNIVIDYATRILEEQRWIAKPSGLCNWCDYQAICQNTW